MKVVTLLSFVGMISLGTTFIEGQTTSPSRANPAIEDSLAEFRKLEPRVM